MLGSAQIGARLGLRSGPCSWVSWGLARGLGTRDSTWLVLGLSPAHLARPSAWDRAEARFGLEARLGSNLRARPGSGLGTRLGSEPGSAHLGSENIISETKHERRKCMTKTVRRGSVKVRRWKQTKNAHENATRKKKYWTTRGYTLSCFQTEQRQAAPGKSSPRSEAASPRSGPENSALRGPSNVLVSVEIGIFYAGGWILKTWSEKPSTSCEIKD